MFEIGGDWVYSATDLVVALRCEYQLLHRRAEKAGRVAALVTEEDALLARAARLGEAHEERTRAELVALHGKGQVGQPGGVVEIARPDHRSRDSLVEAHQETLDALRGGAEVVYQAAFFDGRFHGMADFVCRVDDGAGPLTYAPADTKLSRHARVEALLQLRCDGDDTANGTLVPYLPHSHLDQRASPIRLWSNGRKRGGRVRSPPEP